MSPVLDRLRAAFSPAPVATPLPPASPWADREHFVRTTWADLFGTTSVPVTRSVGMRLGALSKPRHLLVTTVSQLPVVAYRGEAKMEQQPLICRQPEVGRPRSTTILWAMDAMYWFGRVWYVAAARSSESEGNKITRVRWVPEWAAEVDADGNLVKAFGEQVQQRDVVRVDGPHEGILNFATDEIRDRLAINLAASNASANPVPSIDLHQTGGDPLKDDEIDSLTARWVAARAKQGGGVGFTNQSIEARVLGQPVEQLLIAAKTQSDLDLVRASGAPAWAADVAVEGSAVTYSNSPSRARELLDGFAAGYMTAWADRFSMDDILPAGSWCKFSTVAVLAGNFKERMEGYKVAIEAGIYTPEQCALIEAGQALEGI